ncbi:MAG: VWA domain-containing protein [Phycisphaerae bacterium]|nr:VWA domain-containing protein [Phycisphaerae bacterium]
MSDLNDFSDDTQRRAALPADELDAMLRIWHEENADRAAAGRDGLLRTLAEQRGRAPRDNQKETEHNAPPHRRKYATGTAQGIPHIRTLFRRIIMNRYSPAAAAVLVIGTLITLLGPTAHDKAHAGVVMQPQAGRLDALDAQGHTLGPCPLEHTDVNVEISGFLARVTLVQRFHNPYHDKIEAVYTFPMSHRAAVDRMTMTIGERVVIGEVHERNRARAIYEAARERGHVASLLEQERPNIFTQSVANIEPDTDVLIEISYVELLERKDGVYSFDFPMVVGPRYIPGTPTPGPQPFPAGLEARYGLILVAPADLTVGRSGDTSTLGPLDSDRLRALIGAARPIAEPNAPWWTESGGDNEQHPPQVWYEFEALYPGVSREFGTLYTNGVGQVGGRWFCFAARRASPDGTGFARDTNQVPDASRITPMPTKPPTRAGHDISITVNIDTGGPGIDDLQSDLHEIDVTQQRVRADGLPRQVTLELASRREIPNRDFILSWRQVADTVTESVFTHAGEHGSFFTLILQPPGRVDDAQAVPRELVFVLDTSGSMSGFPIDKAKACMAKAIDGLRKDDTFNVITFSGDTHILWDQPRAGTWENIAAAQNFLASREGRGGTEMMKAISAALERRSDQPTVLSVRQLANLPADGREVIVRHVFRGDDIEPVNRASQTIDLPLGNGATIRAEIQNWTIRTGIIDYERGVPVLFTGRWVTKNETRVFEVEHAEWTDYETARPLRIVCFMTDGYVGNDMAIIDAVRRNAQTTRVFSFGIGNSVNRYLLDGMAEAGGGAADYVPLNDDADEVADRFLRRIQTPVLTDVEVEFSEGLHVADVLPEHVGDLWDHTPIVIHGRYTEPGTGTLTIRGNAGEGPYERVLELNFPESQPEHDTIATLWARAKVEQIMNKDLAAAQAGSFPPELRRQVVELGERFGIMTQFTSFVAVEKLRLTVGGRPRLVSVPIELPDGVSYEGVFGERLCGWAQRICQCKTAPRWAVPLSQTRGQSPPGSPLGGSATKETSQEREERLLGELYTEIANREKHRLEPPAATKDRQVAQLMEQAEALRKEHRFDDAAQVLTQIQAIDPQNEQAALQRQILEALSSAVRSYRRDHDRDAQAQDPFLGKDENGILWFDTTDPTSSPEAWAAHPRAAAETSTKIHRGCDVVDFGITVPAFRGRSIELGDIGRTGQKVDLGGGRYLYGPDDDLADLWSVARANSTTPKQSTCPSTTTASGPGWRGNSLGHTASQYGFDPKRRVVGTDSEPAFVVTAEPKSSNLAWTIDADGDGTPDRHRRTFALENLSPERVRQLIAELCAKEAKPDQGTEKPSESIKVEVSPFTGKLILSIPEDEQHFVNYWLTPSAETQPSYSGLSEGARDAIQDRLREASIKVEGSPLTSKLIVSVPEDEQYLVDHVAAHFPSTQPMANPSLQDGLEALELVSRMDISVEGQDTEANRLVRQTLDIRLPALRFDARPLEEVLDVLRAQSGLSLVVNWEALEARAVERDTEVSLRLHEVRLGKVLELTLDAVGAGGVALDYVIEDGAVKISTLDDMDRETETRAYFIPGPEGGEAASGFSMEEQRGLEALIELIRQAIDPEAWRANGGCVGSIEFEGRNLLITHSPRIHRQIVDLLTQLRTAYDHVNGTGATEPADGTMQSRDESVSAEHATQNLCGESRQTIAELRFEAEPLEEVIDGLGAMTGLNIIPRWYALESVAVARDAEVTLGLQNVTFEGAMEAILDAVSLGKVDLTYEIEDNVVQVSTRKDLSRKTQIRVYDVGDLTVSDGQEDAAPAVSVGLIAELIQQAVAPDSWTSAGGHVGSIHALHHQLIMRQTARAHAEITALLRQLRQGGRLTAGMFVSTAEELAFRRLMALCEKLACLVDSSAMLPEQVAIHIAGLYTDGRAEDARRLADALVAFVPDFETGVLMRGVLSDAPFADAYRAEQLVGLSGEADAAIDAFAGRLQTFARRIDERLLPLLMKADHGGKDLPGITLRDGGVVVSVLAKAKGDAVLGSLKDAGLAIDSVADSANVIVGIAPVARLADIALLDVVRRIEPIDDR